MVYPVVAAGFGRPEILSVASIFSSLVNCVAVFVTVVVSMSMSASWFWVIEFWIAVGRAGGAMVSVTSLEVTVTVISPVRPAALAVKSLYSRGLGLIGVVFIGIWPAAAREIGTKSSRRAFNLLT